MGLLFAPAFPGSLLLLFRYWQVQHCVGPLRKAAGGWSDQVKGHAQRVSCSRSETSSSWDGNRTLSSQSEGRLRLVRPGLGGK